MSGYVLHLLVYGVCCGAVVYFLDAVGFPLPSSLIFAAGGFYALLPDADAWNAKIRLPLSAAFLILFFLSPDPVYGYAAAFLGVFLAASILLGHRGFLHSIAAGLFLSLPLALVDPVLAVFCFFGYLTHLAADGCLLRIS